VPFYVPLMCPRLTPPCLCPCAGVYAFAAPLAGDANYSNFSTRAYAQGQGPLQVGYHMNRLFRIVHSADIVPRVRQAGG
jgi:Lipase (class 3)